ncbi:MAG: aspartate 1-decarboxylase [Elusimicrobiota bacterium]|jgi:aspartate 1-decarboxylase|nr:aspartate 1-decarboxylase [Elusimicrobiota bacterium]
MFLSILKSKIHRAVVTGTEIDYIGSITISQDLMRAAGLLEYEKVHVADIDNGNRFETYVIKGPAGSGQICLNGAAAKLVKKGDKIIIMAYAQMEPGEAAAFKPRVVFVDADNKITSVKDGEEAGAVF